MTSQEAIKAADSYCLCKEQNGNLAYHCKDRFAFATEEIKEQTLRYLETCELVNTYPNFAEFEKAAPRL